MKPAITFASISVLLSLCTIGRSQSLPSTIKIGYADVQHVMTQMPDIKRVESDLAAVEKQLIDLVNSKTEDLKKRYEEFKRTEKTMLEPVRKITINELHQSQMNLEQLKQDSQLTLDKKHTELMKPIYEKIGKAIEAVAKEQGYSFILSSTISGQDVVMYADPAYDISDLVLKKLGAVPKTAEPKK